MKWIPEFALRRRIRLSERAIDSLAFKLAEIPNDELMFAPENVQAKIVEMEEFIGAYRRRIRKLETAGTTWRR